MAKGLNPEQARFFQVHEHLVEQIVLGLRPRIPASFETADLRQAGHLGLVEAAHKSLHLPPAYHPGCAWTYIRREVLALVGGEAWLYAQERKLASSQVDAPVRSQCSHRAHPAVIEIAAAEPDEETESAAELRAIVEECIAELPDPQQRELVELIYEHSISIHAIGRNKLLSGTTETWWGISPKRPGVSAVIRKHDQVLALLREKLAERGITKLPKAG